MMYFKKSYKEKKRIEYNNYNVELVPLQRPEELRFYNNLRQLFPSLIILAQVDLKALIKTDKTLYIDVYNSMCQLSVDFVICDTQGNTLLVIEHDGPPHRNNEDVHSRDVAGEGSRIREERRRDSPCRGE